MALSYLQNLYAIGNNCPPTDPAPLDSDGSRCGSNGFALVAIFVHYNATTLWAREGKFLRFFFNFLIYLNRPLIPIKSTCR